MHRSKIIWRPVPVFLGLMLVMLQLMSGQTPAGTTPPPAQKPKRVQKTPPPAQTKPANNAAPANTARPAAVSPAASAPPVAALPARPMTSTSTAAGTLGGLPSRIAGSSATSNATTPATANTGRPSSRTALTGQGLGTFHGADYTLTAYGCYRSASDVLCDFDITKLHAGQVGLQPFSNVVAVDNGGKINRRSDAYYMAADGSRMENAYVSPNAVRYVMQFNGVGQQTNSLSLVLGGTRLDSVPITAPAANTTAATHAQ